MLIAVLSASLLGAVIYDLVSHRLPNHYLLLVAAAGFACQTWLAGWDGAVAAGAGLLTGFVLFLPLYALGGMAAGDVKLMACAGCFLGSVTTLWAAAYSVIAGALIGIAYLALRGQLIKLFMRYWAMASLRAYIPAEYNSAARHRFPYAIAIATGSLLSLYWTPV